MTHNEISAIIIDAAIEVHRLLGPGMLEKTYELALCYELELRGLRVERQVAVAIVYKGLKVQDAYRIDALVERKVVVELKVVEQLTDVHKAQTLTYLKCGGYRLGLLINFAHPRLIDGLVRIVHKL